MPQREIIIYSHLLLPAEAKDIAAKFLEKGKARREVLKDERLKVLTDKEADELAWRDGFRWEGEPNQKKGCIFLMHRWFSMNHEMPFIGHIMYWA